MSHRLFGLGDRGEDLVAAAPPVAVRALARRFWPIARPYRRALLGSTACLALVAAIDAAEIWLFGLLVDEVLVPQELAVLPVLVLAYLGLWLAGALAGYGDEVLATRAGEGFLADLRTKLFAHLHALDLDTLQRRPSGDLLARLTGDVAAIERFLLAGLQEVAGAVLRILFFGGALLLLSWKLALAALVVAPLFVVLGRRFATLTQRASREKRRRTGSLSALAEASLRLAPVVHTTNRQDDEVARFRRQAAATVDAELGATRVRAVFGPLGGLVELVGGMTVVLLGVWALRSGDLSLGQLLVFLTYLTQLYGPMRTLGDVASDLFAATAGAERVTELLALTPRVRDRPDARPLPAPVRGAVHLDGVTLGDRLHGVELRIAPGELVALTGPSGAGKTSLARLLLRIDDPDAGTVRLDGHDLRDVTLRSLRDHVGLLWQDSLLPDVPVAEAIAEGRGEASPDAVRAAARDAGVEDLLDRPATRLSGGQQRRVAVARALLRDCEVLVLDEPTTGLDAAARDALLAPLKRLAAGRTTIVITHDPEVMRWADRVVALRDGRLDREAVAA